MLYCGTVIRENYREVEVYLHNVYLDMSRFARH